MEDETIARRAFREVYSVSGRADQYEFLINAVEASGGRVIYASDTNRAPLYLGVQMDSDERLGLLVYPFRITRNTIKNRPTDEVRGQLRYGSEESWKREHPVGRDVAGVDVTMILGVDLEAGIILGLDANLWDPLPMGISFYARDAEIDQAKETGWHVWEKINRAGSKRSEARSPTSLETVVAFTPDRLIDDGRLKRWATSLRLDPPLRYSAALAMAARDTSDEAPRRHVLEEQFALTSQQILDIIGGRNRLAVAVRGGVAEYPLELQLQQAPVSQPSSVSTWTLNTTSTSPSKTGCFGSSARTPARRPTPTATSRLRCKRPEPRRTTPHPGSTPSTGSMSSRPACSHRQVNGSSASARQPT